MSGFNNTKGQDPFGLFPDITNYRVYLFLMGGEVNEISAQMDEYNELYSDGIPFSTEMYKVGDSSWTYFVFTFRTHVEERHPVWYYFDNLLWMSVKANLSLAYACPKQQGYLPIIACRDEDNQSGESCKGIANGKYFRANIPYNEVNWGQSVPVGFDYIGYVRETYGIDVSML